MKTTEFDSRITAAQLNESMFKKFGVKVNFDKYTREELENYRNLIRTNISQFEAQTNFNDLLTDESYQKNKHLVSLLNQKIKEMLGEGAKVDRQAMHITKSMMKKGKSKDEAEAIAWAHIKHPKKKKKAEEGIEETTMNKTNEAKKGDGNLANNAKPYDKITRGDVIAGRLGKDEKGGKAKKVKEETGKFDKKDTTWTDKSGKKHPAQRVTRKTDQLAQGEEDKPKEKKVKEALKGGQTKLDVNHNGKLEKDDFAKLRASKKKKQMDEARAIFRNHVRVVNESLAQLLAEDEEGKAKAITAASDMVNDYTTWMQRVGQYQTKSMIELADNIRSEFGQAEAETFKQAVAPALAATIETLTAQREAISHAVAVLAGEAQESIPMGGKGPEGMEPEPIQGADDDSMNTDGFETDDAAAGGMEPAGREMREGRVLARQRRLAEAHSIMRTLSK
jgi:hypothetical protein